MLVKNFYARKLFNMKIKQTTVIPSVPQIHPSSWNLPETCQSEQQTAFYHYLHPVRNNEKNDQPSCTASKRYHAPL